MSSGSRILTAALVAALSVAALAGCRKRSSGDTIVNGSDIFTTDDFPGAPVQAGNLAQDQRAMSPDRESVLFTNFTMNGDRGTGMLTWIAGSDGLVPPIHLYCSYYDGAEWTPPVHMAAPDALSGSSGVRVAFLNTAGHASETARERDGDAIILWTVPDTDDDGAATADGANNTLFSAYFNVSTCKDASARYGFQEFGTRISTLDAADEDVTVVAVVSDGLCGENRYGGQNAYRYGDDTTGIVVAWIQAEDNDSTVALVEDRSLWYSWFDPAAAGDPELPLVPSAATRIPVLGFGASDSGLDSEETQIDSFPVAYNNLLFFRVASRDSLSGDLPGFSSPPGGLTTSYGSPMAAVGDDVTLEYVAFDLDSGSVSGPISLAAVPKSSDLFDTTASNMAFLYENAGGLFVPGDTPSIYGSDEGLAATELFFVELSTDTDAVTDFGNGVIDGEVRVAQIDESTGALDSTAAVSDGDISIFDTVGQGAVSTRISRNGDYIWIAWQQRDSAGGTDDRLLKVAQLTTTRPDEDGAFVLPPVGAAVSSVSTLSADIDGHSVTWAAWQAGLGYVCGVQSDPDVLSIAFQHSSAVNDQVFIARLTADLSPSPVPSVSVALFETFPDALPDLATFRNDHVNFVFADAGANGDIVAAYVFDVDPTAGVDQRLFSRRNGTGSGVVEIDSATSVRQVAGGVINVAVTPPGSSIGTFDPVSGEDSDDRPHPASYVHFFFQENNTTEDSGAGFALRTRRFNAGDGSSSFLDSFVPPVGADFQEPFKLCLPFVDPSSAADAALLGIGIRENAVGVWFHELGHAYYQEVQEPGDGDETGWRELDGVTDPALIDDDSETELATAPALFVRTCGCDTMSGAVTAWVKVFDVSHPNRRLQVRVRDAE